MYKQVSKKITKKFVYTLKTQLSISQMAIIHKYYRINQKMIKTLYLHTQTIERNPHDLTNRNTYFMKHTTQHRACLVQRSETRT